jgi:nucleoside-diphosphate-sugar epimerase
LSESQEQVSVASDRSIGRLLVTGAPGWLTDAFLQTLATNGGAGATSVRVTTLPGFTKRPDYGLDVEWVEADLRDEAALGKAVAGMDSILHTAGMLHVKRINEFYDVNTTGTIALGRLARDAGVQRLVFLSSNAAAGKGAGRQSLIRESDEARPLNDYGRSKLLAEQGLLAISGLEVVNLRPCMFFGPPVPPRHVEIYQRILTGRMPMVGSGDYARSVIFIDDLVEACRLSLIRPAAVGQTYFIADPTVYTTKSVVDAMSAALGVEARYMKLPAIVAPAAFAVDTVLAKLGFYWRDVHLVGEATWNVGVSVEKATRDLGFTAKTDLATGMQQAVAWCRERKLI